ncbi:MAG: complement resistance protein TraT [Desulfovibrio sp.]|nr:complement resistance protein TraT [Desulfovibrio sp.]
MRRYVVFLPLAFSLAIAGCIPRNGASVSGDLTVLRSGSLTVHQAEGVARVAYVSMRDGNNRIFGLRAQLERCLVSRGFSVTNNPSEAGYIIRLSVPAAGASSPEAARGAVDNGYAGEALLSGTEGTALVADALVVQRRVPQSGKRGLKTISNRMAVADSQMRLALFSPRRVNLQLGFPEYVTEKVAGELCSGLGEAGQAPR